MHDTTPRSPDRTRLVETASAQHGYFTAAQARDCGYSRPLLSHHSRNGKFLRVGHGLYRLRDFPPSRHEEVMAAWLAADPRHAVVSHETALHMFDLSDVIPDAIHITVPRSRRWYQPPQGVRLHTTTRALDRREVTTRDGIRVTTPARSIADAAASGLAPDQVEAAVREARRRGLATHAQLVEAAEARGGDVVRMVRRGLVSHTGDEQ